MNAKISSIVIFLLCNTMLSTYALQCVPDSFRVLRGEEQPPLAEIKPERTTEYLQQAACTGEKVMIETLSEEQVAFVQHGVNVIIDCAPLLGDAGKPVSGSFKWSMTPLVSSSNGLIPKKSTPTEIKPSDFSVRKITGDFDRFLNITASNIYQGRRDPDNGIYTCEACSTTGCFSARVILYLVGAPPTLKSGEGNVVGEDGETYPIGTDICVERGSNDTYRLTCGVARYNRESSPAFPTPSREWYKDDVLIYSVDKIGSSVFRGLNSDFYTQGTNSLLLPGVLLPMPCILRNDGSISINFQTLRVMLQDRVPEDVTDANLQEMLFETLLGNWRCEVKNSLGSESAVTVISECP